MKGPSNVREPTTELGGASAPYSPIWEWVEKLRADVAGHPRADAIHETLGGLATPLNRLLAEHEGMSEELLGVYEQLGVVFEVCRQLPTVQRESEVVHLFVDCLRRSFQGRQVWAVRRAGHADWSLHGLPVALHARISSLLDRAAERAAIEVETVPEDFSSCGLAEVMVGPVTAGAAFVCAIVLARGTDSSIFRVSDMNLLVSLTTFCGDLIRSHRLTSELRSMSIAMVRSLVNAVDQKDEYTSGHSLRVAYYATMLARELHLSDLDLQMLQWSALLHDVGKIGIRDDVLKKEGKLTTDEFAHMKEHPVRSHQVVQEVPQLADALAGVLHHHERYDGTGYPAGLKGEAIPLQARIIQIADVFDALTSNRSYRKAFAWTKALTILEEEAGKTVDPRLRQLFDRMIRRVLEGNPDAWERLVTRASRFAQEDEPVACDRDGE